MNSIFLYIIIHPIAAFIGWLLCGLVKQNYLRIALRSAVLAIAFTPAVVQKPAVPKYLFLQLRLSCTTFPQNLARIPQSSLLG